MHAHMDLHAHTQAHIFVKQVVVLARRTKAVTGKHICCERKHNRNHIVLTFNFEVQKIMYKLFTTLQTVRTLYAIQRINTSTNVDHWVQILVTFP